jgi:hypothetical protein
MNLSVLVLIGLLALIAARKVGHIRVAIWQAMAAGALLVLAAAQIALLLLPLAFGSAMSPIGNPPNLLIAVRGPLEAPCVDFLRVLAAPTRINLALAFLVLRTLFHREFHRIPLVHSPVSETDPALARLARCRYWLQDSASRGLSLTLAK